MLQEPIHSSTFCEKRALGQKRLGCLAGESGPCRYPAPAGSWALRTPAPSLSLSRSQAVKVRQDRGSVRDRFEATLGRPSLVCDLLQLELAKAGQTHWSLSVPLSPRRQRPPSRAGRRHPGLREYTGRCGFPRASRAAGPVCALQRPRESA